MDNFACSYGDDNRFGIVCIYYDTQLRTLKDSAKWCRDTLRLTRNGATR